VDRIGVHESRRALALAVALAAVAGCRTEYVVDARVLETARQEASQSGHRVAVPVERMDVEPVYVRYERLDVAGVRPPGPTRVMVSAPARRGHRIAGPILLSFGLTALVAGIGVIGGDLANPCPMYSTECWGGMLTGLVGLPLTVSGIVLTIPGGILTYLGYHDPSEVPPSQRDLLYLSR
jgi:hypothetical protein